MAEPIKVTQFTLDEEIRELGREITLRKTFYPKQIAAGKLTQEEADYQLGVLISAQNRLKAFRYFNSNMSNPY